jgi:hypothetical protein
MKIGVYGGYRGTGRRGPWRSGRLQRTVKNGGAEV